MAIERIIGVDFGTSTSVIRVKRYENGKPVGSGARLDTQKVFDLVPTVIQEMNGHRYYGEEALTPKGRNAIIYRGFKVNLESTDEEKREQARKLTEEFMAYLAAAYKTDSEGGHLGDSTDKERTIISYPVKWSDATKDFMLAAARKAGFPNVEGMDEAQAAINAVVVQNQEMLLSKKYLQEDLPATILLIDMGAGTTDLVLCRYTPGKQPKNEILATWPKDGNILFGGQEVDELLRNFATALFEDKTQAEFVLKRIPLEQFKAWKETEVAKLLANNETVEQFYTLDDLADMAGVALKPYNLDRVAFESWAESYLKQFPELVNGCLQSAGISGEQVDLVVLTGGHSQWYFSKDILAGKIPQISPVLLPQIAQNQSRIVQVAHPQETAALGLVYSGFFNDNDEFSPEVLMDLLNTNPTEAREYLRKYAEQGVAVAQWAYADCFLFAHGGEKDIKAAHIWYKKAAEQGIAEAFLGLARIHFNEEDKEHYNLETATEYLKKAADLGHVPAQFALACTYSRSERYDKALKYFEMAAEQGHVSAQYFTGYQYYIGYGTKVDFSAAIKWLCKTIENPNEGPKPYDNPTEAKIGALKLLGNAYEHGEGVPADMTKANTYYRQAKELEGLAEDEAVGSKCVDTDGKKTDIVEYYRKHFKELIRNGLAIRPDGSCIWIRNGKIIEANGIKKLFSHDHERSYILGISKDGRIVNVVPSQNIYRSNKYNQMHMNRWEGILDVASDFEHTAGLLQDGTVVAIGRNHKGQCNVEHWSNIVQICCDENKTAGLQRDGRVVTTYEDKIIAGWKDIVTICYPYIGTELYALRKDGTILTNYTSRQNEYAAVAKHVVSIVPYDTKIFALLDDGTVWIPKKAFSAQWRNIVSIAGGRNFIAGLKSDGSVIVEGKNNRGQCNVSTWYDVIAICAHPDSECLYALRKDGRVYYNDWKDDGFKSIANPHGALTSFSIFDVDSSVNNDIITGDDLTQGATFDMSDIDL